MKMRAFGLDWRKILRNPLLFVRTAHVWFGWLRDHYGVEIEPNKVRLFHVSHIVLTDSDVEVWR